MTKWKSDLQKLLDSYPVPSDNNNDTHTTTTTTTTTTSSSNNKYDYGTAGFRMNANLLKPVFARVGVFAAIYSAYHCYNNSNNQRRRSSSIGIMCTASHNPVEDNGVKIADVTGGMLDSAFEKVVVAMVHVSKVEHVLEILMKEFVFSAEFTTHLLNELDNNNKLLLKSEVHIGYDTREHSKDLVALAVRGVTVLGGRIVNHGLLTTPMLHYFVSLSNNNNNHQQQQQQQQDNNITDNKDYYKEIYLDTLCNAYAELCQTGLIHVNSNNTQLQEHSTLCVDCACGVGSVYTHGLATRLNKMRASGTFSGAVELITYNKSGDGPLNDQCGAEFVQKRRLPPQDFTASTQEQRSSTRCCSLDGDADRIVFYYKDETTKEFELLDGDKIASLIALFIQTEINILSIIVSQDAPIENLRCGIVQTAYANGSSTMFLKNTAKIDVKMAKTGVKYVHKAAHDNFDIGIYFEANGHGTVLFSSRFFDILSQVESALKQQQNDINSSSSNSSNTTTDTRRGHVALQRLKLLPKLINQTVGDALSDMLLVEAVLYLMRCSNQKYSNNYGDEYKIWNDLYKDLPSKQVKVSVPDRKLIQTNEDETRVVSPLSLQNALDEVVKGLQPSPGRVFVRPSGTEDAVRIYAEGATQLDADLLAEYAKGALLKVCHT